MPSASKRRTARRGTGNARRSSPVRVVSRSGSERLQYKVIELSTVDEGTIESTINEWVALGWQFDGVQFAMRDASKRPAMAFVLFTRLRRSNPTRQPARSVVPLPASGESAWERLRRLAEDDEQQEPPDRSSE